MPQLAEVFNTNELINYFKERTVKPMFGEALFPERKIPDVEFDMILGKGGLPVSAEVYAFDTQTKLASRKAIEKGVQELALIKRKIKITEKELIKINNPRTNAELEFVLKQLYKDAENLEMSIRVRVEKMRMEALSTGKIKIEENGVKVAIDYGVPKGNIKTFNWSDPETAKPLDDLTTLADAVEDAGSRPTRALTSRKIVRTICKCKSIREAIHGVNSAKTVTLAQLNELLSDSELPIFLTYEEKYEVEGKKGFTKERYFPENVISMFGDGPLGETIYGLTAEEVKLIGSNKMETAEMVGNVFVGTYTSEDPVGEFTKAAATAIPSFPTAADLGIANITM